MKRRILNNLIALLSFFLISSSIYAQIFSENAMKFGRALGYIDAFYVDSVNQNTLTERAIIDMLRSLDPHSVYISAKDVKEMNEPLIGNFEGIGITFNLLYDTIIVTEPVHGGPSEKVGLQAGDRIVIINGEKVTGIGLSTSGVRSRLMGPKGTKVNISVFRKGKPNLLEYTIIRDKIPINSLVASYMLNNETGYILLNKFAAPTNKEFSDATDDLKKSNMQNLILDLRGNPGGYMQAAVDVINQFLTTGKLIVYMQGRKMQREDFKSTREGTLTQIRLVVLTDEASASASEILAGAIQDWDRGIIMGRRTFGKGLVQNGYYLTDGSMVRLTVARYYTPTGRSIQRPYNEGYDKYMQNYLNRFKDGELIKADSSHYPDSLQFYTKINHRPVYGGGGIMPDVFVALDTSYITDYYKNITKALFSLYILDYIDKNRTKIRAAYKTFEDFNRKFEFTPEDIKAFIKVCEREGVKYNEKQFAISKNMILKILKGLVAGGIWQNSDSYRVVNEGDVLIEKALKIISDKAAYNKILGY